MNSVLALARSDLVSLKSYESARSLGMTGRIFLDANESPVSPIAYPGLNRYPEPQPRSLQERFTRIYGVPSSMMLIGRGSDEAIDLVTRAFCAPGDAVLICPPTYGMYEVSAQIQGAKVVSAPLLIEGDHIQLNVDLILQALNAESRIKILYLCSPNNPTGTSFDRSVLNDLCEKTQNRCLVVVDEAYAEFSEESSMLESLRQFPNLVVLRTLSKAWGIAGARCGVALGQEEVIQLLHKIRPPYPLSTPAIDIILEATDDRKKLRLQQRVRELRIQREELRCQLMKLKGVKRVFPSAANFILTEFEEGQRIFDLLKNEGIILRNRSKDPGLMNCIRTTIGTLEENEAVLSFLQGVLR